MTDETESKKNLTDAPKPPGVEPDKPPPDEFLGRGNTKKKKKPAKERPVKTQVEEQIDAALAKSAIQGQKKLQKKKRNRYIIGGGVGLLLIYGIYMGLKPYEGGLPFGICKVFLQTHVRYPDYLRLSTVEEFETSVRIWYTQVDSFGEYRMEPIQCYYKQDEQLGTILDKVLINRRELEHKKIDDFNRSLPVLLNMPLELGLPTPLPDSLQDLQFETDRFRKPIL